MKRRDVLAGSGLAVGLAGHASARVAAGRRERTYVFVHGAWHGAVHWGRVVEHLARQGHAALAIDLPGSGLQAPVLAAYRRADKAGLAQERSAIGGIGLEAYAAAVIAVLQGLAGREIVLVGHSFGGQTITRVAERAPDLVHHLVYVTAFCPATLAGGSVNAYAMLPENGRSLLGDLLVGDPAIIGAFRMDVRSTDPAYLEKAHQAFYGDVPMDTFLSFASYFNSDTPLQASSDDGRGTVARWGRVPRSYVRCTLDRALPLELQDRMIREADLATPANRFAVHSLASSHSPFASMPEQLAAILIGV